MFDIGWSEIIVIIIVASIALDIKDIPTIIKGFKQIVSYINNLVNDIKNIFIDIEQDAKKIVDLEGVEQTTYDLDDIMPDIKPDIKK